MRKNFINHIKHAVIVIALGTLCVACGKSDKNTKPVVKQTTAPLTVKETEGTEPESTEAERTLYVKMDVISKEEGIEVRILDSEDHKILNVPFTVCVVETGQTMILDKEQSATIEGDEYSDEDGDGTLYIEGITTGSYEIYLRPIDGYKYATPTAISLVFYVYDDDITDKIKQADEVDVEHEDKSYVAVEKVDPEKVKNAIKVSNMMNAGFILGESKKMTVNVPMLTEDEEVQYEKLSVKEADTSLDLSSYIKDSNKVDLLIEGEMVSAYLYDEKRFDMRVDEYYVSEAIVVEGGKRYIYSLVPHMTTGKENVYVGWYSKNGKHFYNKDDGYPVTGWQKLDGMWYYFNENGQKASITGVDVSEYQEEIDWVTLKESGIDFAIIRCGFRGYETGVLVEDSRFRENIQAATDAGMPFGVYIFSQAVNGMEAAEEASMILSLCEGYEPTLPYAIDIESCGDVENPGRQNRLTNLARTQVINTFVDVIESRGEEAMLYSNKRWLEDNMDLSQITCKIWYAMWPGEDEADAEGGAAPNNDAYEVDPSKIPNREVEIWQYSSKGQVGGIETLVDLNAWVPSLDLE